MRVYLVSALVLLANSIVGNVVLENVGTNRLQGTAFKNIARPQSSNENRVLGNVVSSVNGVDLHMRCQTRSLDPRKAEDYCSEMHIAGTLEVGDMCILKPHQANPTQLSIGKVLTHCMVDEIEKMDGASLHQYLLANQVPVIIGPKQPGEEQFYITDKHHLAYALLEAYLDFDSPHHHRIMYACIDSDYSDMGVVDFWESLAQRGDVWLRDERGERVFSSQIPSMVKNLADDPYRTMSEWLKHGMAYIKCSDPENQDLFQCVHEGDAPFFLEYEWAQFLREHLPVLEDVTIPEVLPKIESFVYQTNLQSQWLGLMAQIDKAFSHALGTKGQIMPGYNWSRDKRLPFFPKIDSKGCIPNDQPSR